MTLGNSPQPLTRRQLRELARENEPASAENGQSVVPSQPAANAPEEHHSRHTSPAVPVDRRAEARPAPAPLPIPDQGADDVVSAAIASETGRTLTRRELRALQTAASAGAESSEDAPAAPPRIDSPRSDPARVVPAAAAVPVSVTPAGSVATAGSVAATGSAAPAGSAPAADPAGSNGLHPPIGHWSVDREDDSHIQTIGRRDDQTFDDLVGRGIGAGGIPTTTNALILPAIPRQGTAGPITSTGEIMITGSIDLPRSLGATGQHPNLFDSSEMDRMLDQLDEGGHHNDVAPVSASRAVSTHTSTRGVMTPPRKRGASLPTVLAITAAVLAIGVLSLFVVGYAFNIY
ncbi:hypothetical protein BJQ94_10270 [Cryobacterium sp. SO2]|uniref:hypothetical protein n=1 Tax=Cryobacterium sp. SO2 TaxID=1897060 RepID=UPI00223DD339|nr:hypothetical protein [Cryobacterium sp. SO2]WEO75774.1 hypothetical protein BJQ94_10270 [Cryobacterium sp. SO2]